jgi:Cd2+/Zn2+-exporting ATPase/Cu+-exporting ATPase
MILALLIPLILNVVHLLEERSIMGGREVIDNLIKLQQRTATVLEDGVEREVDAQELQVGQTIVVKPGMGIPIDGVILSGQTNIDQKSLTGEPHPAYAKEGDTVYAGTTNLDGRIVVEVKKAYENTTFSKILQLLEQSEGISLPESRLIDRFLAGYIPFVLGVAALVSLITRDITQAIAILVVSCPCGQMLVNSAPMIAALSAATKRGILIKNSKFIEELTEIDTVVFDKTGTITKGELTLTQVISCKENQTEEDLLYAAASLAAASNHPVSRAVLQSVEESRIDRDVDVREITGGGVEGLLKDGSVLRFGRGEWLAEQGISIPENFPENATGSVSYVAKDAELLGCLTFNDTARENAAQTVQELKELGIRETVMLTGDRQAPAQEIQEALGIDRVYAQLLPQDKLEKLRQLSAGEHNVLAVGDGINDALALREADVGIAMGAMGSDVAIESADIALMNNNLMNIPFVMDLARRTRKVIYQNLVLSISISVVMIALSAFGVISALAGSILHNFGAFAVLLNSSRILREDE